jgi:hypothetical protein
MIHFHDFFKLNQAPNYITQSGQTLFFTWAKNGFPVEVKGQETRHSQFFVFKNTYS